MQKWVFPSEEDAGLEATVVVHHHLGEKGDGLEADHHFFFPKSSKSTQLNSKFYLWLSNLASSALPRFCWLDNKAKTVKGKTNPLGNFFFFFYK